MKNNKIILISAVKVANSANGLPRWQLETMQPLNSVQRNVLGENLHIRKIGTTTYTVSGCIKENNMYAHVAYINEAL